LSFNQEHIISFSRFPDSEFLSKDLQHLLHEARMALNNAYEPYSKFKVGAAVQMANGEIYTGFNIENASYPVCICAERTALSAAITAQPKGLIKAIAISYLSISGQSTVPISPCGVCRQFMYEMELRNRESIAVICAGLVGEVLLFENCAALLPFGFDGSSLK
jgi:cytidine deaminase